MRSLLIAAVLPLVACGVTTSGGSGGDERLPGIAAQGSGNTRTYPVSGFTGIESRGSDTVDVRVGPGFSVRADGDPKLLDQLKFSMDGTNLRISRQERNGWSWGAKGARISVTMPRLTEAAITGSGDMTIDRVVGSGFNGAGAGSGSLSVAALQVDKADISLAGSGDIKLAGTAKELSVSIAGSGDVEAGDLKAERASVSVAGSGSVRAGVAGPASVSVMGSGDVDLGRDAKCQTTKMGTGSVRCGG